MKKLPIFIFIFTILSLTSIKAEEIKIYLSNKGRIPMEGFEDNINPLYVLTSDTLKAYKKVMHLKIDEKDKLSDIAFSKLYFIGWDDLPLPRQAMFLFVNYKSDTVKIIPDLNHNLDFTDEKNIYYISKSNPNTYIDLPNQNNPNGKFRYRIGKLKDIDSMKLSDVKEYYYNDKPEEGLVTTEPEFWFFVTRSNILSSDTIINGKKTQIGLRDENCNGLYKDGDYSELQDNPFADRVLVGEYGSNVLIPESFAGSVKICSETSITINKIQYLVTDIEETGKYICLKPTGKASESFGIGEPLPDFEFELINGNRKTIKDEMLPGKFNLIDIWAIWCKGCVLAVPKLKMLDSVYHDDFKIISLHESRTKKSKVERFLKNNKITWTNGYLTTKIAKKILAGNGYPFYILVNKEGNAIKFTYVLDDIISILEQSK
ncbi:TlpA family protein disulfide reductase [Bacteroidota bacterium]